MELRDKEPDAEVSWAKTDGQRVSHKAEATAKNLMVVVPIETEGRKRGRDTRDEYKTRVRTPSTSR